MNPNSTAPGRSPHDLFLRRLRSRRRQNAPPFSTAPRTTQPSSATPRGNTFVTHIGGQSVKTTGYRLPEVAGGENQ
jgi:hypothetical protein